MTTTMTAPSQAQTTHRHRLDPVPVSVRIKLSALWASMMFVFVYVDLFSFFRADVRAEIESGEIAGFTIDGTFLLVVTAYILLPALMIYGSVALKASRARKLNLSLAVVYAVTIVGGAVGEWGYYLLGSAVELVILAAIVRHTITWPKTTA